MTTSTFVPISAARFDYYAATLPDDHPASVYDLFAPICDEPPVLIRGQNGYANGFQFRQNGRTIATGYEAPGRADHVKATGSDAPMVADFLRRVVPAHRVSRADVALDFVGSPDLWPVGEARLRAAISPNVKRRTISEDQPSTGHLARTLYLGSRSSEVFTRFYESGKVHPELPADAVRLETEVKPTNAARKAEASSREPLDFYGYARSSRQALDVISAMAAPIVPPRVRRPSDHERSLNNLAAQYGNVLVAQVAHFDGDLASAMVDLLERTTAWNDSAPLVTGCG